MEERTELFSSSSVSNFLKKNIILLVLVLGGLLMIIVGGLQFFSEDKDSRIQFEASEEKDEAEKIFVDISGAVNEPGVYEMNSNERISDAIEAAGGLTEGANTDYISKNINRAEILTDGMKIYLPFEGEEGEVVLGETNNNSGLININSASQSQLEELPGIGPVRAGDIISGRPYSNKEELITKKVIGTGVYDDIEDLITAP